MEDRRKAIAHASDLDAEAEIGKNEHYEGDISDRCVALYHFVFADDDFKTSAAHVFSLIQEAQKREPNKRRVLYLDIEGHRQTNGAFDGDSFELQRHFILGLMFQWLAEVHLPLLAVRNPKQQRNDIPDKVEILDHVSKESLSEAIELGADGLWFADKDTYIQFKHS